MNELPLSKFAPFTKEEACYQHEVSNKLKEIEVKCSNCIYLSEKLPSIAVDDHTSFSDESSTNLKSLILYKCSLLDSLDSTVNSEGLCRFFTNLEEVRTPHEETKSEDVIESPNQEMSVDLQKLDFSSNTIIQSIKDLRTKLINEDK